MSARTAVRAYADHSQGFEFKTNELLLLLMSTVSDARRQH